MGGDRHGIHYMELKANGTAVFRNADSVENPLHGVERSNLTKYTLASA